MTVGRRATLLMVLAVAMILVGTYFSAVYPFRSGPQGFGIVLILVPGGMAAVAGLALLVYSIWSLATGRSWRVN